ncbi:MAG: ATP-binding cassette domain-containing protein [Gemmatimonadaceae bacterium]
MPVVRFSNVYKEYPRTGLALSNVSFSVQKGEFVDAPARRGAGKSTILEADVSGGVPVAWRRVDCRRAGKPDQAARDVPPLRRKLGVVFQDFRLLEDRTVEANIMFALEVLGARKKSTLEGRPAAHAGGRGLEGHRPIRAN